MSFKASSKVTPVRMIKKICLIAAKSDILPSSVRYRLFDWGGLNLVGKSFFGSDIVVDTIYPEKIKVCEGCIITSGTKILSHFFNSSDRQFYSGEVRIEDHVFIGMNTLIVAPVTIGSHAVIAAGSVVTKNIPPYELWGGVPAKYIKSLNH